MAANEQKQIARERRERKLRIWLTTLSWTMPIVAFGGFFGAWHTISAAVKPQSDSTSLARQSTNTATENVLYKIGSQGSQVRAIQEQLSVLGYFNHSTTVHYGQITADAVKAFQADNNLPVTGQVDRQTLRLIQQAVKDSSTNNLTGNSTNYGQDSNASSNSDNIVGGGNAGLSQQNNQIATSSAS